MKFSQPSLKGDHFGEKALKTTKNKRTASVQVVSDLAQCLIITEADVRRLIGDIEDVYPDRPVDKKISGSGSVRHSIEVNINFETHKDQSFPAQRTQRNPHHWRRRLWQGVVGESGRRVLCAKTSVEEENKCAGSGAGKGNHDLGQPVHCQATWDDIRL